MPHSDSQQWWSPFRKVGAVTVSHIDLTSHAIREASALTWLNEDELSRSRRFLYPGPSRRFVLCRSALRAILCAQLGCENRHLTFGQSRYGKPYAMLRNKPIMFSFNISHSGKHGLIAFATHGQLGVDVEERTDRKDIDDISKLVFGPNEQSALESTGGSRKINLFFKFWTIKEALIKAVGMGFFLDPLSFELPPALREGTTSRFQLPQMSAQEWRLEYIGNKQFAAAVAYEAATQPCAEQLTSSSGLRPIRKSGD